LTKNIIALNSNSKEMFNHLFFILVILIIIVLIKFYLESQNSNNTNTTNNTNKSREGKATDKPYYAFDNTYDDANSYVTDNDKFNKMVEDMQKDTIKKINHAVEQGVIEGFSSSGYDTDNSFSSSPSFSNNDNDIDIEYTNDFNVKSIKTNSKNYKEQTKNKNNNDSIISYLNKGNSVKLMLFYKASCHYCSDFMPVWYKIVNNLSNNVMYEEIECEKDYKKANEYQISTVPTIILLINNEKKVYTGDREYSDIMRFLKINGVNLIERTFEEFDSSGYSTSTTPTGNNSNSNINNDSLCPAVTFNSQLDVADDNYMFQIFNEKGQYGYSVGGNNSNKQLTPFTAAYSTFDSYLTSLPEGANISECANNYASQLRGFGLCDAKQLDNILQYEKNVKEGNATSLIDGTDYSSNNKVVTAIKNACGL